MTRMATGTNRTICRTLITLAFGAGLSLAHAQGVPDASNEADAARQMLDNQAIVEASAAQCKTKFPEQGAAIDIWLGNWNSSDAHLFAAAEALNAKSATPTLKSERRALADAKIAPGFAGGASTAQLQGFCSRLFAPDTLNQLRERQPRTVQFLSDAYDRLKRDGQISD
jgi:hypothetical protein